MKVAVNLFAAAALTLGGCSGKAKDPAGEAAPAADGKGSTAASKPNPWAKDPPPGSVPSPDPAAKDQAQK